MGSAGWGRALLALALVAEATAILIGASLWLILRAVSTNAVGPIWLVLPALVLCLLTAYVIATSEGPSKPFDRMVILIQIAFQIGLLVLSLLVSHELLTEPRTIAPIALERTWPIFIAAFSAFLIWGLLEVIWSGGERAEEDGRGTPKRVATISAAAAAVALTGLAATTFAADRTGLGCDVHRFDREGWQPTAGGSRFRSDGDRRPIADALVECRSLAGLGDPEVRRMLGGDPLGKARSRRYGVGDSWFLQLTYGPDGEVVRTGVYSTASD